MKDHFMMDVDIIRNKYLSVNDKFIYSVLCDRMMSLVQSKQVDDKKDDSYYIIYTVDEMAKVVHLSCNDVRKSYEHLALLGFLVKKRVFNSATKLFLPKFDVYAAIQYEALHN
jgi:hypothetical protein